MDDWGGGGDMYARCSALLGNEAVHWRGGQVSSRQLSLRTTITERRVSDDRTIDNIYDRTYLSSVIHFSLLHCTGRQAETNPGRVFIHAEKHPFGLLIFALDS